jgi:ABC-type transport system involved in multi-copper enzyme maturation permease subunit
VNGTPAAAKDPIHARVAGALERAFNPIMLKELRASLRGLRFFIAHIVILSLFAAGLMIAFVAMIPSRPGGYDDPGDPSHVGRGVYLITQFLQLGVAFLVVPGLAATSISSERESLTHDLLLTTTMTARQIVWGKFTAAMTQAFTIFISMVPLVSLCFLFGGVTVYQILANYAFLFALSTAMIAYALSMSASARTTQRAVGSVYGLTLVAGAIACFGIVGLWDSRIMPGIAVAYGFLPPVEAARTGQMEVADRILYIHLLPGFLWAAMTSLFFINATNRLKPLFANRSTPLRIYYLTVLLGAGGLVCLLFYHSMPPASPADDRSYAMMGFAIVSLTASLLGGLFACEEPFPSLQPAAAPAPVRKRRLASLFLPGSNSGAAFTVIAVGLFLAISYAAFWPFQQGFDRGAWAGSPRGLPLACAFLMVLCWTVFTSTFARYLSALLPDRPMLLRTILILSCLFLALFPLVHWAIAEAIDRNLLDEERKHGPITLALSPVMAILSSLDLRAGRREFPLYAGGWPIPVAAAFAVFSLTGGAFFYALGNRARTKLLRELTEEPGTKVRKE